MQHLQSNTTLLGGKYRIERMLGQGGFGITYLTTQVSLNRLVAIKELFLGGEGQAINERRGNQVVVSNAVNQIYFDQQKDKFKKEALRLANLNHPNLVNVHEFFEENGTAYYVMDYIDGMSLRTKLNKEGCLSENLVLNYLQQIISALEVAHKQNIWHLDIKPENIMVDKHEHVYLIDFGASKHIEQGGTLTTSLALAYTRSYCPPELADLTLESETSFAQALTEIGPWTDIYSLGATMYNLLTENVPPSSNRLYRDGRNAFVFPDNISSSIKDLIVWMMKPDREDRPESVKDIKIALNSYKYTIPYQSKLEGKSIKSLNYSKPDAIKNEANKLRNELKVENNLMFSVLYFVGMIILEVIFVYIVGFSGFNGNVSAWLYLLSPFASYFIGGAVAEIYCRLKNKDIIEKWKRKNPNDPRNKYL